MTRTWDEEEFKQLLEGVRSGEKDDSCLYLFIDKVAEDAGCCEKCREVTIMPASYQGRTVFECAGTCPCHNRKEV